MKNKILIRTKHYLLGDILLMEFYNDLGLWQKYTLGKEVCIIDFGLNSIKKNKGNQ